VEKQILVLEIFNVAPEDWITVSDIVDEMVKAIRLNDVKKVYKPVLHGVRWLDDVRRLL
jgi:UDP-glucose 4-epimerase